MSKRLEGITIVIDGDTSKLNKSLRELNAPINEINKELKNVQDALKLDPSNLKLVSQEQEVLKRSIETTKEKLEMLKQAQQDMGSYSKLTDEQKAAYNRLSVEIAKTESSLKQMKTQMLGIHGIDLSKLKDGLKKVGDVALDVVKKVGQVSAAVGGAMAGVVAAGVKSYGELQQNLGGVETLFKDNAQKVIENAQKAYKTAGVSANEYMQGVTSFSASLLQSLGGDTAKAADVADMAFRDMSDNANKFGTDMSSIQNAYQGFAKQNYTMLDNLKLGYGGTKTEMERLLKDAEKLSGQKYDIKNLSDVYNAIHVIQGELEITGTTAAEAEHTITGSASAMKAAFDNFINGSGSPEELANAVMIFLGQLSEAITKLAPNILSGITTLISTLLPQVVSLLISMIPQLLDAITNMINKLFDMVSKNTNEVRRVVQDLVKKFVEFLTQNLPTIIELGLMIILALATGIADSLPDMVPAIIECIMKICDVIIENLDTIIEVALYIIVALGVGIVKYLGKLLEPAIQAVQTIWQGIIDAKDKMIDAAKTLIENFKNGIINRVNTLKDAAKEMITGLWNKIKSFITETDWLQLGKNILNGILNGMLNFGTVVKDTIKKVGKKITNSIKDFFGIASPSKLMSKEVGQYLTEGIAVGFEKGIPQTIRDVNQAMKDLNGGIQSSLNPTINPTANTNPLIIQIENFNNTRQQDVQALAEELEFYRKNSALARGGN